MDHRVLKALPRRPRARLPKGPQEHRPDAAVAPSSLLALPSGAPERPPKRQFDESDPPPEKRARLASPLPPEVGTEESQATDNTPLLYHPRPNAPYASILETFADPPPSHPRAYSEKSFVLDWLEAVGADRDAHCRSDSHLQPGGASPVPRELARSAPAIDVKQEPQSIAAPLYSASADSFSWADRSGGSTALSTVPRTSSSPAGRSLVESPNYRDMNLAANNIFIRALHDPLPPRVADIVRLISLDRGSPEPLREDIEQDEELNELWLGAGEHQVEHYFKHAIFPNPGPIDSLRRVDRQPMAKHTVPTMGFGLNISNPVPDMLYGYNRPRAFHQQQSQLISMGAEMVANDEGLMHPFLLVEFEGQGPSGGGNLWAATNQCLGGSASCVNMAETFNQRLRQCRSSSARPIDSVVFSVATNGTEARLYVTWCQFQLDYYMARVGSFLLHDPEHYLNFRKYVRNILDWGNGQRLDRIRGSLDCLFEDGGN